MHKDSRVRFEISNGTTAVFDVYDITGAGGDDLSTKVFLKYLPDGLVLKGIGIEDFLTAIDKVYEEQFKDKEVDF